MSHLLLFHWPGWSGNLKLSEPISTLIKFTLSHHGSAITHRKYTDSFKVTDGKTLVTLVPFSPCVIHVFMSAYLRAGFLEVIDTLDCYNCASSNYLSLKPKLLTLLKRHIS